MSHPIIVVVCVTATLLASAFFVAKSIRLSAKMGMVDQPAERRATMPLKPRGAGGALLLAFAFGVALSFSLNVERFPEETERILLLLAGATLLTGVTVYDDAIGLGWLPKLGFQLMAAGLVVVPRFQGAEHGIVIEQFNFPIGGTVELPLAVAVAVTLLWFVGTVNTINFVDGLDGLAASITLIACAIMFGHTYFWPRNDPQFTISLLPAILGATVLGFLPFNWFPAKVTMGDAGAYFLGFALAGISIIGGAKIATALLVLGFPILDVAWVITVRLYRRGSPAVADRIHLHYRLIDRGWSQPRVTLFISAISGAFGCAGLLLPTSELKLIALGFVAVVLFGVIATLALHERKRLLRPAGGPDSRLPRVGS